MTQAKISHPGRTTPEEMVSSRYALRVGEIEVLVISDGVLPLPTTTMSTNADPDSRASWLKSLFLPADGLDWPLNAMVVRTGEQVILVDAGLGGQFPGFPRAGQFAKRLEHAGIELSSVTDVVITHMHMDHVGGLLDEDVKAGLSRDARIHVAQAEVDFWVAPDFSRTVMPEPVPDVLRATATQFADHYRSQLRTFEDEYEVAPGVLVWRTGGHTPGHSVVRISSGGDQLTFAGDAIFPPGFDHPDWQNGFEHDPEEAHRVRLRLLREFAASGEMVVATHLAFPSVGHVSAEGESFRYVPAYWDY